jgi:hypothetical protein
MQSFGGKARKGNGPLRKPRHMWEDNIKTDIREIGWGGMEWIDLAQDRDQCRSLVDTSGSIKCWEILE